MKTALIFLLTIQSRKVLWPSIPQPISYTHNALKNLESHVMDTLRYFIVTQNISGDFLPLKSMLIYFQWIRLRSKIRLVGPHWTTSLFRLGTEILSPAGSRRSHSPLNNCCDGGRNSCFWLCRRENGLIVNALVVRGAVFAAVFWNVHGQRLFRGLKLSASLVQWSAGKYTHCV